MSHTLITFLKKNKTSRCKQKKKQMQPAGVCEDDELLLNPFSPEVLGGPAHQEWLHDHERSGLATFLNNPFQMSESVRLLSCLGELYSTTGISLHISDPA